MQILAHAKINLALDVLHKRPEGYHEVDMVMQSLELADTVRLTPAPALELECDHPAVPCDERNLAWRAARLLQETMGISHGVRIVIEKKIPVAAGLAGGSSNAAAVLIGLNQLWKLGLSSRQLQTLGVKIGADVPFCIVGGTMRAQGIGEILTPIQPQTVCRVLLVTPNIAVPTAHIYQQLRVDEITRHPNLPGLINSLELGAADQIGADWGNVLEPVAVANFPEVTAVKQRFARHGLRSLMSGSGPSVFALDPPETVAQTLLNDLPDAWFGCITKFKA